MAKMRRYLVIFSLATLGGLIYTQNTPKSFQSLYKIGNAALAGLRMGLVYKFNHQSDDPVQDLSLKHYKASRYLKDALARNGGIYIKLGQLIASLDVIVPFEYRQTLSCLTRKGMSRKFSDVRKTIEEDYQCKLEDVFSSFDQQPFSSASIAQVHKAVLKNGQIVAVKVQHRNLADSVQSDLMIMKWFVFFAKATFKQFKYEWLLEQFQKNLKRQLDFKCQAQNAERTRRFLQKQKFRNVKVPLILNKPTKRVLVMEYIDGIHVDEIVRMRHEGINTKQIGRQFARANILMIHQEGFVHADPHSGNLMVRKNKITAQDELFILDHGLYQELQEEERKNYNEFWLGLVLKDQGRVQKAAAKLGTKNGKLLCSMLTSKQYKDLNKGGKQRFNLKGADKNKIIQRAAEHHEDIVDVLNELKRDILLLLKVNEFARTIENDLGGREMGVYEDIANCCVRTSGLSWWRKVVLYLKIYWTNMR